MKLLFSDTNTILTTAALWLDTSGAIYSILLPLLGLDTLHIFADFKFLKLLLMSDAIQPTDCQKTERNINIHVEKYKEKV
jgi:hypothetical protein